MSYKIIIFLITSLLLVFSGEAFSQGSVQYTGTSITDFTIYKVVPKKTSAPKNSGFNADINDKKTPGKTEPAKKIKPFSKPVVNKKQTPAKSTHSPKKIVKTPGQSKLKAKKPLQKASPAKQASKPSASKPLSGKSKTVTEGVREIETTKDKSAEQMLAGEHEKALEFNKRDYTKNLNKLLENDSLIDDSSKITTENNLSGYDYIIKPSVSLAIVIFIMLIIAWIYGKIRGISPNSPFFDKFSDSNMNKFKVLATSTLGQGKVIQLVEINGKQLVIGSTNNNINLLTEITSEEMDELQAKAEAKKGLKRQAKPLPEDEQEYYDPDSYSSRYSDLYKEYTEKKEDK